MDAKKRRARMHELATLIRRQIGTRDLQGMKELCEWTLELATLAKDDLEEELT